MPANEMFRNGRMRTSAALDDVAAEALEVARSRGAGVDQRGDAARLRIDIRIDAERGAAPIDMRVQVDQPRHHYLAGDVARLLRRDRSLPTAATLPSANATSAYSSTSCAGSMTRPPFNTRSNMRVPPLGNPATSGQPGPGVIFQGIMAATPCAMLGKGPAPFCQSRHRCQRYARQSEILCSALR